MPCPGAVQSVLSPAPARPVSEAEALMAAGIAEGRIEMQKPIETTGDGSLEAARRVEVTVR